MDFQRVFAKNLRRGQRKDYGLRKDVEWNTKLTKNVQEKRNLWLLWTEECRSANGACPYMRVNSVGRGRRRGKRGVVRRILRRRSWRKGWGLRIHRRRFATLARCKSNTTIAACSTGNITSGQGRGAAEGLFREVSQHVSRLQTVNAYCVSLAFPIDREVLGPRRKTFQRPVHGASRKWRLCSLDNMTCEHVSKDGSCVPFWNCRKTCGDGVKREVTGKRYGLLERK